MEPKSRDSFATKKSREDKRENFEGSQVWDRSSVNFDGDSPFYLPSVENAHFQKNVPKMIGRYPVIKRLGRGSMGAVYLGVHPGLNRQVAIRTMQPGAVRNRKSLLKLFGQKAQVTDPFCHANIISVYDVAEDASEGYFIVMEYAKNGNLHAILEEKGKFDLAFTLHIIKSVAKALIVAHKHGIVHLNICPWNIMVCEDDEIKLAGLELAEYVDNDENANVTSSNTGVETSVYIAPEQRCGGGNLVDIRADIFALGATFYHLVTGEPPLLGKPHQELVKSKAFEDFKRHELVNPEFGKKVGNIISKMVAPKPEDRYQSPEELLQDLENCRGDVSSGSYERPPHLSILSSAAILVSLAVVYVFWQAVVPIVQERSDEKRYEQSLAIRISNFTKDKWEPVKDLAVAQEFPGYSKRIRRRFAEASQLLDKKVYEEAFHKYREILKILKKLQNLDRIKQACLNEQTKIQSLITRATRLKPDLVKSEDWKKAERVISQANSFFERRKLMEALALFKNSADTFTKLFTSSVDQHVNELKTKAISSRDNGLKLGAPSLAPELWKEAEDLAGHAENAAGENNKTNAVQLWEEAVDKYRTVVKHVIVLRDAERAKEQFLAAVSKEDPTLVEKYRGTIWKHVSDSAIVAEQLMNEHQFQAATHQWQRSISLIPDAIKSMEEKEASTLNDTNSDRTTGNIEFEPIGQSLPN